MRCISIEQECFRCLMHCIARTQTGIRKSNVISFHLSCLEMEGLQATGLCSKSHVVVVNTESSCISEVLMTSHIIYVILLYSGRQVAVMLDLSDYKVTSIYSYKKHMLSGVRQHSEKLQHALQKTKACISVSDDTKQG